MGSAFFKLLALPSAIAAIVTWFGRELFKAWAFDRVLHVVNPSLGTLIEYAPPAAFAALTLFLIVASRPKSRRHMLSIALMIGGVACTAVGAVMYRAETGHFPFFSETEAAVPDNAHAEKPLASQDLWNRRAVFDDDIKSLSAELNAFAGAQTAATDLYFKVFLPPHEQKVKISIPKLPEAERELIWSRAEAEAAQLAQFQDSAVAKEELATPRQEHSRALYNYLGRMKPIAADVLGPDGFLEETSNFYSAWQKAAHAYGIKLQASLGKARAEKDKIDQKIRGN